MYWGTIIELKEKKEDWDYEDSTWHLREHDRGEVLKIRIPAVFFLFIGLQFLYNEIAITQGWPATNQLYSMLINLLN